MTTATPTAGIPRWAIDFLALSLIWGGSFLLTHEGAREFGPLPNAFLRVGFGALVLIPVLWRRGSAAALRTHGWHLFVVGVLNCALPYALFSWAVLHISTGLTSILNATSPLFGALVAWLWLKDRPANSRVLGLAIGFVGVALLVSGGSQATGANGGADVAHNAVLATMACLLATTCYGLAGSYTKLYLKAVDPIAAATGSQLGATVALLVPALYLWPAQNPSLHAWQAVAASGALCTAVAFILYFRIIAAAGPAIALSVTFLIPVFALMFGALFLHEIITLRMVLCGLVVVAGTVLATGLLRFGKR